MNHKLQYKVQVISTLVFNRVFAAATVDFVESTFLANGEDAAFHTWRACGNFCKNHFSNGKHHFVGRESAQETRNVSVLILLKGSVLLKNNMPFQTHLLTNQVIIGE